MLAPFATPDPVGTVGERIGPDHVIGGQPGDAGIEFHGNLWPEPVANG